MGGTHGPCGPPQLSRGWDLSVCWERDGADTGPLTEAIRALPLQTKEHGVQKKAYRVLEEVCAAPHGPCQAFVRSNLGELKTVLLDSLKSAASPAKRVQGWVGGRGGTCWVARVPGA